jgi:hypothetical protein
MASMTYFGIEKMAGSLFQLALHALAKLARSLLRVLI